MEHPPLVKILDIFRSRKNNSTFFILTKKKLYKVNQEMYINISQGYVFKNDTIRILKNDQEAGIIFELADSDDDLNDEDFKFDYLDYIYHKYTLFPFLTDTLPFQSKEIDFLPTGTKVNIFGKILYKTRINNTQNSQYLFYIIDLGGELIKAIVWKENLKYSSLKVGDCVAITKLKHGKGYPAQGHIENNEFSEMGIFNIREITVLELFRIENIAINLQKLQLPVKDFFYDVEGFINYRSVLNRRNNHSFMEYYLLRIGNKKVMLFYNSDLDFYKIEAKNIIEITNLRKIFRKGETFYISTVFTQFCYKNITEQNELCSTFLHEMNNKRKIDDLLSSKDEYGKKKRKQIESKVEDLNIKPNTPDCESQKLDVNNVDLNQFLDDNDNSIALNIKVIAKSTKNPDYQDEDSTKNPDYQDEDSTKNLDYQDEDVIFDENNYIESAYGFLPDSIYQDTEENLIINGINFSVTPFFIPKKISLKDLENNSQKLLINESEKYLVEGKVLEVETFSSINEYFISYIENDVIKNQFPLTIYVENCLPIYIFKNFFAGDNNADLQNKVYDCIGRDCYIVLHVFRASIDHVIYSVSDIEKK